MIQQVEIHDADGTIPTFKLRVHMWLTIRVKIFSLKNEQKLKEKILEKTGYPIVRQRLFYNNMELDNKKDLEFYDILKSFHGKIKPQMTLNFSNRDEA